MIKAIRSPFMRTVTVAFETSLMYMRMFSEYHREMITGNGARQNSGGGS